MYVIVYEYVQYSIQILKPFVWRVCAGSMDIETTTRPRQVVRSPTLLGHQIGTSRMSKQNKKNNMFHGGDTVMVSCTEINLQ